MIIFIYGEDTFRSRRYLRESVTRFKEQRDPQGYNVVFVDAKKDGPEKIFSELSSTPFLAEKRMVIIEDPLSAKDQEMVENLSDWIKEKKISEKTVAIFWQGETPGKSKVATELAGLLKKEKYTQEFKSLQGIELLRWVGKEITDRGGKISSVALENLCKNAGSDIWLLNSLIDSLLAYVNYDKEIEVADVQLFLDEKIDDNIFDMVEAIVAKNSKEAFKLLEAQRLSGSDEGYLFSMIMRQFKILLQMKDLFIRQDNLGSDSAAKILGIHPFVVRKSLPIIKKYGLAELKEIHKKLLDIDIKTKTGQGEEGLLIDLFVGAL